MSKKKDEYLEVEFINSNIPDYMRENHITCKDYENYHIPIIKLAWPSNKKEEKRYIKRILYEQKYRTKHIPEEELADNIEDDGKNRDYLNLRFDYLSFGFPRTKKEEAICMHRYWMEHACNTENMEGDDEYYDD